MYISRKIVNTFPCCCYMYLRLFLIIGFYFKIDYGYRYCPKDHLKISNTTRSNILPYNWGKTISTRSKILPYNWGKNNIPECYHRTTTYFIGVLSVNAAFLEYMVFFFLKKKKIITLNIKVSLNMKNKSDILIL